MFEDQYVIVQEGVNKLSPAFPLELYTIIPHKNSPSFNGDYKLYKWLIDDEEYGHILANENGYIEFSYNTKEGLSFPSNQILLDKQGWIDEYEN